jgi:hypothetical protein
MKVLRESDEGTHRLQIAVRIDGNVNLSGPNIDPRRVRIQDGQFRCFLLFPFTLCSL